MKADEVNALIIDLGKPVDVDSIQKEIAGLSNEQLIKYSETKGIPLWAVKSISKDSHSHAIPAMFNTINSLASNGYTPDLIAKVLQVSEAQVQDFENRNGIKTTGTRIPINKIFPELSEETKKAANWEFQDLAKKHCVLIEIPVMIQKARNRKKNVATGAAGTVAVSVLTYLAYRIVKNRIDAIPSITATGTLQNYANKARDVENFEDQYEQVKKATDQLLRDNGYNEEYKHIKQWLDNPDASIRREDIMKLKGKVDRDVFNSLVDCYNKDLDVQTALRNLKKAAREAQYESLDDFKAFMHEFDEDLNRARSSKDLAWEDLKAATTKMHDGDMIKQAIDYNRETTGPLVMFYKDTPKELQSAADNEIEMKAKLERMKFDLTDCKSKLAHETRKHNQMIADANKLHKSDVGIKAATAYVGVATGRSINKNIDQNKVLTFRTENLGQLLCSY